MWPWRCKMWSVGSPKSQFIPAEQFCSKQRWSLPLWSQVWGTQGDKTPGYYTSNSKVLNKGVQANLECVQLVGTNNEHFPVCQCDSTAHPQTSPTYPSLYMLTWMLEKFLIPIPMDVTLSPRYFGAPSYRSL